MSNRRRHDGNRENPDKSKCVGVFGLSLYTTERELEKEFGKFGPLEKCQVVLDGHVAVLRNMHPRQSVQRSQHYSVLLMRVPCSRGSNPRSHPLSAAARAAG